MNRIYNIKISGNFLAYFNKVACVQHEANVTFMRIEFDDEWDGYAKKVTFWNAKGESPVERTLTTNLLENIDKSTRIYLVPIPGEPLAEDGVAVFVIDGYVNGKRMRSLSGELEVKPAPFVTDADEPIDPTPTQAEQIQSQIEEIIGTIQNAALSATAAAAEAAIARELADSALGSANSAASSRESAEVAAATATQKAIEAAYSAEIAQDIIGSTTGLVPATYVDINAAMSRVG